MQALCRCCILGRALVTQLLNEADPSISRLFFLQKACWDARSKIYSHRYIRSPPHRDEWAADDEWARSSRPRRSLWRHPGVASIRRWALLLRYRRLHHGGHAPGGRRVAFSRACTTPHRPICRCPYVRAATAWGGRAAVRSVSGSLKASPNSSKQTPALRTVLRG